VLQRVRPHLGLVGFKVEKTKKAIDKIKVPVLFKRMGRPDQTFEADAYHETE
jgi:hypothetical protein